MMALAMGSISWTMAFDAGPHQDLTIAAMLDGGFSADAYNIARIENWLVDYYSNQGPFQDELALLHFDNLTTEHTVHVYWGLLANNSRRALQAAAIENDAFKALCILGMSLHAVQDFYAHSTWAENRAAPYPQMYSGSTFFTEPPDTSTTPYVGIYTGRYPNKGLNPTQFHGSYDWGVNHDNYERPNFDRAFVSAYAASLQWVTAAIAWVDQVRPGFSFAMKGYSAGIIGPEVTRDATFLYYLSTWVSDPLGDTDGRWKAKGSGDFASFLAAVTGFKSMGDDQLIQAFKEPRTWFRQLTPGLFDPTGLIPALPELPRQRLDKIAVVLRTTSFRALSSADPMGNADCYAVVRMGNQVTTEPARRRVVGGPLKWQTIKLVDKNARSVPIAFGLYDQNVVYTLGLGFHGVDDHYDINRGLGRRDLQFSLFPATQRVFGDLNGRYTGADREYRAFGTEPYHAVVTGWIRAYDVWEP